MTKQVPHSRILVLAHPGSACGSADFNIGKKDAAVARQQLVAALDGWDAGILVVDNLLSDELIAQFELNAAIERALARAAALGLTAHRITGEEADLPVVVRDYIGTLQQDPRELCIEVTGAWYCPGSRIGAVMSIVGVLRSMGIDASAGSSAVEMTFEDDDEDMEMTEQEIKDWQYLIRRGIVPTGATSARSSDRPLEITDEDMVVFERVRHIWEAR